MKKVGYYHSGPEAFLDAYTTSDRGKVLEARARGRTIDAQMVARASGKVTIYPFGSLVLLESGHGWEEHERKGGGVRGKIAGFSAASRRRMLKLLASLRKDAIAIFVTLTYPGEFSPDPERWKRDLQTFGKWLLRTYLGASAIWKLEPQKRMAPHFHLLVFGIEFLPHWEVAQRWYDIVGSHDPLHLAAGTQVRPVHSRNGVMRYASKLYMGKEIAGFEGVGRFWGIIGKKNLPMSESFSEDVGEGPLIEVRRIARRYLRSRGVRMRRPTSLFTETPARWADVYDLCLSNYYAKQKFYGNPF